MISDVIESKTCAREKHQFSFGEIEMLWRASTSSASDLSGHAIRSKIAKIGPNKRLPRNQIPPTRPRLDAIPPTAKEAASHHIAAAIKTITSSLESIIFQPSHSVCTKFSLKTNPIMTGWQAISASNLVNAFVIYGRRRVGDKLT